MMALVAVVLLLMVTLAWSGGVPYWVGILSMVIIVGTIIRDPLGETKEGKARNAFGIRFIFPKLKNWGQLLKFSLYMILFTSGSYKLTTGQWSVCGFTLFDPYNTNQVSWGDLYDLQSAVADAAIGDPIPWSDYDEALYFEDISNPDMVR